jgi:hypothetical protein
MNKHFIFASLTLLTAAFSFSADGVGTSIVSPVRAETPVVTDLKSALLAATGYRDTEVESRTSRHLLTVVLVNSKLVTDRAFVREFAAEREADAREIVSAVSRVIASKSEFKAIQSIQVEYVTRNSVGHSRIVDLIEFRKNPQGHFVPHAT